VVNKIIDDIRAAAEPPAEPTSQPVASQTVPEPPQAPPKAYREPTRPPSPPAGVLPIMAGLDAVPIPDLVSAVFRRLLGISGPENRAVLQKLDVMSSLLLQLDERLANLERAKPARPPRENGEIKGLKLGGAPPVPVPASPRSSAHRRKTARSRFSLTSSGNSSFIGVSPMSDGFPTFHLSYRWYADGAPLHPNRGLAIMWTCVSYPKHALDRDLHEPHH
jgi:hypothetical protein